MANNESDIEIIDGEDSSNSDLINWLQSNATQVLDNEVQVVSSSFNSIQLNNNVLTFNGVSYTLEGTAESTDTNLSSFKQVSAVDNGDNTITLTIGSNSIIVSKHVDYDGVLMTFNDEILVEDGGLALEVSEEVNLISFEIVNRQVYPGTTNTYYAEQGMTWAEWCDSQYNTIGLYYDESVLNSRGHLYDDNPPTSYVSPQDVIIANYQYILMTGGGSND